jgi:hypothetical protein
MLILCQYHIFESYKINIYSVLGKGRSFSDKISEPIKSAQLKFFSGENLRLAKTSNPRV